MSALTFSRTVTTLACSLGIAAALVGDSAAQGSSRPLVSEAQFEDWQKELSNWGRWGNWARRSAGASRCSDYRNELT